ncbi:MAG TPA: nitrate reductase molybdenum cofactor assembly chaperone [Gaiellaceae bacterium]|nr:nitrate reductase molybdenum cofactor assembly chaperone [Gaiellaceae bacterium]
MSLFSLASRLLAYPDEELEGAYAEAAAEAAALPPSPAAEALGRFLAWFATTSGDERRRAYVTTFDFDRRTNLYLTYHLHGDRRRRGIELVRLKRRFREAGLELAEGELPDYLPVLLEFAELAPGPGTAVLTGLRGSLELVRAALHERGSAYADLLEAIVLALPPLTRRQAEAVHRLAAEGPPTEQVGLESFTPPELEPFLAGRDR